MSWLLAEDLAAQAMKDFVALRRSWGDVISDPAIQGIKIKILKTLSPFAFLLFASHGRRVNVLFGDVKTDIITRTMMRFSNNPNASLMLT